MPYEAVFSPVIFEISCWILDWHYLTTKQFAPGFRGAMETGQWVPPGGWAHWLQDSTGGHSTSEYTGNENSHFDRRLIAQKAHLCGFSDENAIEFFVYMC